MSASYLEMFAPKTLNECILSDENRRFLQRQVSENLPNSLHFYGDAGMGKTSTAVAYCNDAGLSYEKIDGAQYTTQKDVDDLIKKIAPQYDGAMMPHPLNKDEEAKGKAYIVDEIDRITEGVQKKLLGTLSRILEYNHPGCIKKVIFCSNLMKATPAFSRRAIPLNFDKEISMKGEVLALLEKVQSKAGSYSPHSIQNIFEYHFTNPRGGIAQMLDEMQTGFRMRY